jgi:hypothetical protein
MLLSSFQKMERNHPFKKGIHIFPHLLGFHGHFENLLEALVDRRQIMPAVAQGADERPHLVEAVESVGSRIKKKRPILLLPEHQFRVKGKRCFRLLDHNDSIQAITTGPIPS